MTLFPDKKKIRLMLAGSLLLAAGGIFMIIDGDAGGWFAAGLFLLCAAVFAVNLLPGAAYLRMTERGLETCSMFRKSFLRWEDVEEFVAGDLAGNCRVLFNYSPACRKQLPERLLARGLSGFDGAVGGVYDRGPEDLACLLNEWREKYSGRA